MQNLTTKQKDHLFYGGFVGVTITGETLTGAPVSVTDDDIIEGSFSIERNWVHGSVLEIGCADTSELIFELDNHDGRWSDLRWEGARLTVVLDIDGEPLQAGIFTVDEPPRKLTTMQIRALDDMARLNRPYSPGIPYPASLKQILIDACSQCNVTLHTISFDNDDYVVSQPPEGDDITFHHVVAWVAELAGCNAWIDHLARLQLTWYGDSQPAGTVEIGPDDRWSYELSEADTEITGIVYRAPAEGEVEEIDYLVGTDEYALIIEDNPLLQGGFEAVLSTIYDKIGGFAYRPLKFETIGYPHLWPGDKLTKIIDAEGSETASIITNHLFKLNGKSTIEARGKTETVRGYATGAPFTPRQKRVLRSVARVEAARQTSSMEQAVLRLNELMVNSLGYYTTTQTLPSGAAISYVHDQPLLEESQVIWTRTELGFAWTDQGWNGGDPVWQYGVTGDGSMIARMLNAIGIKAEWIRIELGGRNLIRESKIDRIVQEIRVEQGFDDQESWETGTLDDAEIVDGKLRLKQLLSKALEFDGAGDYVAISAPLLSVWSIELWTKHGATFSSYEDLVTGEGTEGYPVILNNGYVNAYSTDIKSPQRLPTGRWVHVVVSCDGTKTYIYIDGIKVAEKARAMTISPTTLGARPARTGEWYKGIIDDVRIWNIARTQQQIQDNMHKELTGVETGLVSYWKLNEGEGNTAYDSVGSNHGTIYGASWTDGVLVNYTESGTWLSPAIPLPAITEATSSLLSVAVITPKDTAVKIYAGLSDDDETEPKTWVEQVPERKFGTALEFDGVDDGVACGSSFDITSALTIEAWIMADHYTDFPRIAGADGFWMLYITDFARGHRLTWYDNKVDTEFPDSPNLIDGRYHHVAVTYSGDGIKGYVDGEYIGEIAKTGRLGELGNTPVTIGNRVALDRPFKGIIDDVRIWNVARTQQQIQDNMHKELTGVETGLISYWKLNEGEGNTAYDSAGSNHGTIYGASWTDGVPPQVFDKALTIITPGNDYSDQFAWLKIELEPGNTSRTPRVEYLSIGIDGIACKAFRTVLLDANQEYVFRSWSHGGALTSIYDKLGLYPILTEGEPGEVVRLIPEWTGEYIIEFHAEDDTTSVMAKLERGNIPTDWTPAIEDVDVMEDFGALAFEDQVQLSMLGSTVATGGYLNTDLIKAKSIFAGHLNVEDLSAITGKFTSLMAGTAGGARLEMGASSGEPYLEAYDANTRRVRLGKSQLQFYTSAGKHAGYVSGGLNDDGEPAVVVDGRLYINVPSAGTLDVYGAMLSVYVSLLITQTHYDHTDTYAVMSRDPSYGSYIRVYDTSIYLNPRVASEKYLRIDGAGTGTEGGEPTLRVDSSGGWGYVGTSSYPFYQMHAYHFTQASSENLKTDIETISCQDAYETTKNLKVHRYKYRDKGGKKSLGIITEEAPGDVLSEDGAAVDLYSYISLIAATVQEMQKRLEGIEKNIAGGKA